MAAAGEFHLLTKGAWSGWLTRWLLHPLAKPAVGVLALLPFLWLVFAAVADRLGANPAEALVRQSGDWTLRFLCLVLSITPLRALTATPALARFRRMAGLFVYFYACIHMLSYAWFDMGLDWSDTVRDIVKRPFILVGFLALLLLSLLAMTSFNRAIRWMGAKRWQTLHKAVYLVAGLAILHFFWMRSGKNDYAEVFVYAAILALLLCWRVVQALNKRRRSSTSA